MKSALKRPIYRLCLLFFTFYCSLAYAQGQTLNIATQPGNASYSLTSQEGIGLELVSFKANALIDGPLAFTQLELTFKNPEDRTIEGRFKIVMPDQASMSRFAMKINGQWMEGEIVEKQAARRAYEDALHRRQDPALLEQEAGNEFSARIFPIPAKSEKSIIISWSQERANPKEEYRLPLLGLPLIQELELNAQIAQYDVGSIQSSIGTATPRKYLSTSIKEKQFTPKQDWVLALDDEHQKQMSDRLISTGEAFKEGKYFLARVQINEESTQRVDQVENAVILFDTSASNLLNFNQKVDQLGLFINQIESKLGIKHLELLVFDQEVKRVYQGKVSAFNAEILKQIKEREALGASHLESALYQINTRSAYRMFLFSDGMVSLGKTDRSDLSAILSDLSKNGLQRVDAIVENSARDKELLQKLVESKNLKPGKVILDATIEQQLKILSSNIFDPIQVAVSGAKWVWPTEFKGVQKGDVVLVYAELENADQTTELKFSGAFNKTLQPILGRAPMALVERSWVKARIQKLLDQIGEQKDLDFKEALKKQIIEISTKYRVLSPLTAMVVLETEADYERFQIKRNALSDILVIGASGLVAEHRTNIVTNPPPPPPPPPKTINPIDGEMKLKTASVRRRNTVDQEELADQGPQADDVVNSAPAGMARPSMSASAPPPMPQRMEARRRERSSAPQPMEEAKEMADSDVAEQKADKKAEEEEKPMAMDEASKNEKDAQPKTEDKAGKKGEQAPITELKSQFVKRESERRQLQIAQSPQRPLILINPNAIRNINKDQVNALTGEFSEVDIAIKANKIAQAEEIIKTWREKSAVDILSLIAKGKIFVAQNRFDQAARAFGSLVDFFPSRADMIRLSANWLEQLGDHSLEIVLDMYLKALDQRADHPVIYHLIAMTLAKMGRFKEGVEILMIGLQSGNWEQTGRFNGVKSILNDDIKALLFAWKHQGAKDMQSTIERLRAYGLESSPDEQAKLRVILSWETDANDVDFHIRDKDQNHAYYSSMALASGGTLYADITTGYGPECFTIPQAKAYPYHLQAHYYSKGPMGYGGGKVQVIEQSAEGKLLFDERPFVIMVDGAFLDLGDVKKPSFK